MTDDDEDTETRLADVVNGVREIESMRSSVMELQVRRDRGHGSAHAVVESRVPWRLSVVTRPLSM